ncbi:MAG: FG-GAP repeat domain-containing protein, partial [Rhodobacterales bacterium]
MKTLTLLACLLATQSNATPLFENLSLNLPHHIYSGEWNHFVGGGVAVMDCNNDELPDIFAAGGTSPSKLFINQSNFKFNKISIPEITGSTGAYPIDINADGFMDLFVLQLGSNILLKGGPNCSFTNATEEFNIPIDEQWSTAFSAWWNDNGLPYMAVGNYVDLNDPKGPFFACDTHQILEPINNVYLGKTLQPGFCSLSMLTARDASGEMRLRISNDRQYYVRNGYEQMWDLSDERFLNEADGWDKFSIWGMGIASRDITGDGRDEIVLTSMGDQLLRIANSNGTYSNAPFEKGTYAHKPYFGDDGRPSTGWHAQFSDINNDGLADLFIAKGNVDQMPSNAIKDPNNLLIQMS